MSDTGAQADPNKSAMRGGFFAIDRRTWTKVCAVGMNPAVGYLVLARGTARDNRTTCWSRQAIEKYTGISRHRAQDSIDALVSIGVCRVLRESTRPKYDLLPASEIPGLARPILGGLVENAYRRVVAGQRVYKSEERYLQEAIDAGWLRRDREGLYSAIPASEITADLIWMPNEVVTGAAQETPPVELVRQMQDTMTLRLLVDCYGVHDLREDGGVPRRYFSSAYARYRVGQSAQFVIWGFRERGAMSCWNDGPVTPHYREYLTLEQERASENLASDFFHRLRRLVDLGLFEWRPQLVEAENPNAEIIHPYGMGGGNSDDIDDRLGAAAHRAGLALLTHEQRRWADEHQLWLAPVPRHMGNVAMVGVARLRYRPRTRRTAAWYADRAAKGEPIVARYDELWHRGQSVA